MSQKRKQTTRLEICFFGSSGTGEESDIYTSDMGIIDYHISGNDTLFVYIDGEMVSFYAKGIWKRVYISY